MALTDLIHKAMEQDLCCSVCDLNIGGKDLMALGVPAGPKIGEILNRLLEDVVEDRCENSHDALLRQTNTYLDHSLSARKEHP